MKIGVKLAVTISIFNLIGIGLLVGVTLMLSQREITRLVDDHAESIAFQSSEKIQNWLNEHLYPLRSLAHVMEAYKEIPPEQRRDYCNRMMRQIVLKTPTMTGVYANWSPNGLDGMDEAYANTPGTDETGRYISSWGLVDGKLRVSAIRGFSWDMITHIPNFGEEYILDPAVYPFSDGNQLIANMGVPVRDPDTNATVGILGNVIMLSTIQSIVEEIKPFGDDHAMVFSSGGIIAAHQDPNRIGKNLADSETDTFGPFLDTMVKAVTDGTAASFSYQPSDSDSVIQYYAVPFTVGHASRPWTVVVEVSRNTIMAPVYQMLGICVLIGFLSMILMSIGVFSMARSISRPINTLARLLKDISKGDLTKTISITAKNELGDLARYFNFTIDQIKHLVVSIKQEAQTLSQTGGELATNMTETAASINEITANIQSIKTQTNRQVASVKDANTIMGQMVEHIDLINDQIEKQADCVNQSSSAVEQMLANIQSVTQTLVTNGDNVTNLAQAAETGRNGLQEVALDIQEIARESEGLLEINEVIEHIASQTNLLSMNAAIEAAHAGETGKGFAVVADEIRKLAESSREQSKTISDVLHKIKESIDKITASTQAVLVNFEAINDGVKTVTDQERQIRDAMEEQGSGSKAILESIERLNEITGEVERSARGMRGGSREVIKESRTLEGISSEIGERIQEMASGAEQMDTAVNRVHEISIENKEQIETLMEEVSRFKVD
ncbi:putative methyl-accepting chemotaxis protein [Hollandina sp. SP2]